MIVVKIEIWPHGDRQQARLIGSCVIVNDKTGTAERGNYEVGLSHSGIYYGKRKGLYKKGRLTGHLRSLSPYHLVMKAIQCCLANKAEKPATKNTQGSRPINNMIDKVLPGSEALTNMTDSRVQDPRLPARI